MIRKFLLASVGAIALTGSAALAADLPTSAPPPVYVLPYTWTGAYIGGQVGYAWVKNGGRGIDGFDPLTGAVIATSIGQSPNGVIGGANVGYNYQINQFVIGIEGTVDGTSLSNTGGGLSDVFFIEAHTKSDVQGSIRGRLGFAFWDRFLIYVTGGAAFAGFNTNVSGFGTVPAGFPNAGGVFGGSTSISTTRTGWTVGGGLQYALTNNWSVRAEYRYTDFGSINNALFSGQLTSLFPGASIAVNRKVQQNQVQVGVDYKLDLCVINCGPIVVPAVPVVAKY